MKFINKILSVVATAILAAMPLSINAKDYSIAEVVVNSPYIERNGNLMSIGMSLDIAPLDLKRNQSVILTPLIMNGPDTLCLPAIGVYGSTAWVQYQRGILKTVPAEQQKALKYSDKLVPVNYYQNVPYSDWMNGSNLVVKEVFYGCASCNEGETSLNELASYQEIIIEPFNPGLIYQAAVVEEIKSRELSGRAYVDFPVNKIEIYPDYRNNTVELGKIIATIDSVKNDPDITVTSIFIAGTASPEGPYENNVYLAKNRTQALKTYVTNLYNFPKDFIKTDYEPVDWKGLREWLENNQINHKNEILAIVNSDIEPYARNSKIRKDFPTEYNWLLKNVYPALRHSDYKIEYHIRQYTDIAEIAEIMTTKPQKLSLNEMYALASALEPGCQAYNDVFETAVRLYPNDETANLNAANSALSRGDLFSAQKYLEKAGNSAEAMYARAILKGKQGNYAEGIQFLKQAKVKGLSGMDEMIEYFNIYLNQ